MSGCHRTVCGGLGDALPADADIQALCNAVKAEVEKQTGGNFSTFTASSYRSQVVAGKMYYIKVKVGDVEFVHIKLLEPLPHTKSPVSLVSFQLTKKENDKIDFF
ncbi:cystatin-B-like [Mantella aurantiaca]